MSGFSSDWLTLREPADHRARNAALLESLALPMDKRLEVVDLGAGTGSNLRYLLPRLGAQQRWRLIDNDPALLGAMPSIIGDWARAQGYQVAELGMGLSIKGDTFNADVRLQSRDLAADPDALDLSGADLVTASALLDLFSSDRLEKLAARCVTEGAACLFVLTYDGIAAWQPSHPGDGAMIDRLNAHQRRDKGLGSAAGPDAASMMTNTLRERGYQVVQSSADWMLGPDDAALQQELIAGWCEAAIEQDPKAKNEIERWHTARLSRMNDARATLRVGHIDIAASPSRD